MSRKKTRWRKVLSQSGYLVEKVLPHRATGDGTFRQAELPDYLQGRTSGKVCCRPMSDGKRARLEKWADQWRKLAERTKK